MISQEQDFLFVQPKSRKKSSEKETEIKTQARRLQGDASTNLRKKDKPSDNQDNYCNDYRRYFSLSYILFHAITS
jgi:hypothetical protein